MSTSEILSMISLISFILAVVSFVLAIFFWIRFNIPAVIGDLSGRTARKSIEKIRANNERTGKKEFAPSKTNLKRGKITELMEETEKLSGKLKEKTPVVEEQHETCLLEENKQTIYESIETELLEETGLLAEEDENETMLLTEDNVSSTEFKGFVLLEEVMLIHTNETIV